MPSETKKMALGDDGLEAVGREEVVLASTGVTRVNIRTNERRILRKRFFMC
jgi:hypothetical protein